MAQQGTDVRVIAREGFAYRSVKLVVLANGTGMRLIPIRSFQVVKPSLLLLVLPCPNSDIVLTHIRICSLWTRGPQLA
jgi:hypothetical protein